jgi:opacity protein-like surface antigen
MNQPVCAALAAAIAAVAVMGAAAARAEDPHPFPQASAGGEPTGVAFADFQAIYDWRVDDQGALLLKTASDRYYRATFAAPCPELPTAINIGFITGVAGPLDRWTSIYVDGDRCWFKSFDPVPQAVFEAGD